MPELDGAPFSDHIRELAKFIEESLAEPDDMRSEQETAVEMTLLKQARTIELASLDIGGDYESSPQSIVYAIATIAAFTAIFGTRIYAVG